MPKIPKGSAPPRVCTQSETKNVHAKAMTLRSIVMTVKQSAASVPYESMSYNKHISIINNLGYLGWLT